MSHEATTWAYEKIVAHGLKPGYQATLLRLCNHAWYGAKCWPSIESIAHHTNQNEKTVRRHLDDMVETGILRRKRRGGTGAGRQTNVYELVGLTDILPDRANGHFGKANGHQVSVSTPNNTKRKTEKRNLKRNTIYDNPNVENLDMEAWAAWVAYRRSARLRAYTTNGIAKKLAEVPIARQMECVQFSVDRAYNGLCPDRFTQKDKGDELVARIKSSREEFLNG